MQTQGRSGGGEDPEVVVVVIHLRSRLRQGGAT